MTRDKRLTKRESEHGVFFRSITKRKKKTFRGKNISFKKGEKTSVEYGNAREGDTRGERERKGY